MDNGWIKLHRKFSDWEWYNVSEMVHLFIHLLVNANHKDASWRGVEVKRGQIVTGLLALNSATGISIQKIRTCLKRLESTSEITLKSTNKYTIITICNYDSYQNENKTANKQLTNNQQTNNKQITTNKNDKNNKNEKNEKNIEIPALFDFINYVVLNDPNIDKKAVEHKYNAWKENGWKDGNNKEIKNWKSKILNTLAYLPKTNSNNLKHLNQAAKKDSDY